MRFDPLHLCTPDATNVVTPGSMLKLKRFKLLSRQFPEHAATDATPTPGTSCSSLRHCCMARTRSQKYGTALPQLALIQPHEMRVAMPPG